MRRTAGMKPPYTRVRVEYCATRARGGRCDDVVVYLSRSFAILEMDMDYIEVLHVIGIALDSEIPGIKKLKKDFDKARERCRADVPRVFVRKKLREKIQKLGFAVPDSNRVLGFDWQHVVLVFERVPYGDFQCFPKSIQKDLVLHIVQKDRNACARLRRRGLLWKNYKLGKPDTLFTGKVHHGKT